MSKGDKAVILVVDDVASNILAIESLLAADDRILLHASTGEEALKIVLQQEIDLVILDVQMPNMDGFEVANIMQSNKRTKDIPIIFATAAKKDHQFMMKGYQEGAIDYLFKPLDPDVTKAKVSVLLKIQLQKKELIEKNNSLQISSLLINNSADIIGIIDSSSFIIEEINNAFQTITGYSLEETKGASLTRFLNEEDQTLIAALDKYPSEPLSFETQIQCKEDCLKWLQWKVVVKGGKWFLNARDITRQKESEKQISQLNADLKENVHQLEMANNELESFSYSVSHDLKSPLRTLNGYSKIIQESYGKIPEDEGKRLLSNIRRNAEKMGTLIDDLLAFSKLGKEDIHKTRISMKEIVDSVIKDINNANPNHAVITVHDLPKIAADYNLLHQVWVNLISNGIKYSGKKENPTVEIGAQSTDSEVTYYVKDNGAGFDMEFAGKLFGVFQRLHSPKEYEGTGIGLAIVQRVIARHHGRVWAEGKVDQGATFYFSLPRS